MVLLPTIECRCARMAVLLLLLCGCGLIHAADKDAPEEPKETTTDAVAAESFREHVVVTATRTSTRVADVPGNVTILDRQDLASLPAANLADALDGTAGVHLQSRWGNPQDFGLNVRGFTGGGFSSYFVVLVDGVQINDVDSGQVDWNVVPLDRIDHVEIQRGPASALYGDTGLGGVVHLFTDTADPGTSISLVGGDHGEKYGSVSHSGGNERVRYSLSGSHREFDGFRRRSDWDSDDFSGRVQVKIDSRSKLVLSALHHRVENENPGPLSAAQIVLDPKQASYSYDGRDQDRQALAADYSHRWDGGMKLSAGLSHRIKDSAEILTLPLELQVMGSLMPVFDTQQQLLDVKTTALQSQLEIPFERGGTRHHFLAGIETSKSDLDSRYRPVDPSGALLAVSADGTGTRNVVAVYLQDQIAGVGPLSFALGIRYDRFDDEFNERVAPAGSLSSDNDAVSPRFGMTWSYRSDGDLFVQAGRGFRAPTLEQLFDQRRPFGSGLSSSTLRPQESTNYEIGIRQSFSGHADLEVSLYHMRLRNEIEFDPATFQFNNIGRSEHEGLELSLTGHFRPDLVGFLTYTFQDATLESGSAPGNQIIFVPRHLETLGLRYGAEDGWQSSVVLRVVGRQYLDELNQETIGAYSTVDARVGYRWKQVDVFLAGTNLFDEEYATNGFITPRSTLVPGPALAPTIVFYPASPRAYRAGMRWHF